MLRNLVSTSAAVTPEEVKKESHEIALLLYKCLNSSSDQSKKSTLLPVKKIFSEIISAHSPSAMAGSALKAGLSNPNTLVVAINWLNNYTSKNLQYRKMVFELVYDELFYMLSN